jgi:hypothetical protein
VHPFPLVRTSGSGLLGLSSLVSAAVAVAVAVIAAGTCSRSMLLLFLATPDILFVHVTIGKTTRFNQHRMGTRSLK